MKKNITLITRAKGVLLLLSILFACQHAVADVTINSTNFPDNNFRNRVAYYDKDGNGVLSTAELNAVTGMYLYNYSISSLQGISYFTNLETLNCESNYIKTLNLTQNTKLKSLSCKSQHGNLTSLKVPTSITSLDCSYNTSLGSLDLSSHNSLVTLTCSYCGLTSLKVSAGDYNLRTIYCDNNKLKGSQMTSFLESTPYLMRYGYSGQIYLIDGDSETEENDMVDLSWYSSLISKGWFLNGKLISNWYAYNEYFTLINNYVPINKKNFPDTNFRAYVKENCQSDGDNFLSSTEINNVKEIHVGYEQIENLKGVEHFTELLTLDCVSNQLTSLDVSKNTKLTGMQCDYNNISELKNLPQTLQWLCCSHNALTSLDLSAYNALTDLDCSYNNVLSTLKVGSAMKYLDCANNNLSTIGNLSSCTQLRQLNCSGNTFVVLEVNNYSQLIELTCHNNPNLVELHCKNNSKLTLLNVYNVPKLTTLYCNNNSSLRNLTLTNISSLENLICFSNALQSLDVSGCPNLKSLNCESNQLTTLDVQQNQQISNLICSNNTLLTQLKINGCKALEMLDCSGCTAFKRFEPTYLKLEQLIMSGCTALEYLACKGNDLTVLDVSNCSSLAYLDCNWNKLTSISMTGCSALKTLDCSSNLLQTLDLSQYSQLVKLNCSYNRQLTSLNLSGCTLLEELNCSVNKLEELDVSAQTSLWRLSCSSNKINSLNLNIPASLKYLDCGSNKLTSLNLSGYTKLHSLSCSYNDISSLNLTGCTALRELYCYENELSSLNLTNCTNLEYLDCSKNNLTSITMPTSCNQLNQVRCYANRLRGSAMNQLVAALPTLNLNEVDEYGFPIDHNPEYGWFVVHYSKTEFGEEEYDDIEEHNIFTPQNVNDAKAKNWTVLQTDYMHFFSDYSGENIPTAIPTVRSDNTQNPTSNTQYNLSGQRVGQDYKGITIVNGKKVVRQ